MLVIALLIALLDLVEASLRTPRIASPSPSSTSQTPFITATIMPPAIPLNAKVLSPAPPETEAGVPPTSGVHGPKTTPPPEGDLGGIFHEIYGQKYTQTTYWSCVTFPLETQCGWHEPILKVDSGATRLGSENGRAVAIRAGVVVGIVGLVFGV